MRYIDKKWGMLKEKAFLIPSCDVAVEIIDDNYDRLKEYYDLPCVYNGSKRMSRCFDKSFTADIAMKAGFQVPKTMMFHANDRVQIDAATKRFAGMYPLIIKEDNSVADNNSISIIMDEVELLRVLKEYGSDCVMLQQFVKKDEEIGVQGVGFGDGTSFIPGAVHKIRTSVDSMGSTTYAEIRDSIDSELKSKCESFIREFCYSGIFDIEVIRKGKEYFFIECNFRNGAYGYAYTRMGYNLPHIWMSKKTPGTSGKKKQYLINEFNDIKHIKERNIKSFRWLKELILADVKLTMKAKDMVPFF